MGRRSKYFDPRKGHLTPQSAAYQKNRRDKLREGGKCTRCQGEINFKRSKNWCDSCCDKHRLTERNRVGALELGDEVKSDLFSRGVVIALSKPNKRVTYMVESESGQHYHLPRYQLTKLH